MPTPKWLLIGRNHYRLTMSGIRPLRPYFPYLLVGLLAIYVGYLAPRLVDAFIDEALAFLLSQAAVAMIQIILFAIFLWFVFFPVSLALKEVQASQLEIFLSAPVKPSHLLLGEFLGSMPFYAIGVVMVAGVFTSILGASGVGYLQIAIMVAIFLLTFFLALWIGTVAAALLRTTLGRSERGRDIGKGLGFLIALPVVGVMYAIMGGGLGNALSDPASGGLVRGLLGVFPSSWGARVIIDFVNHPGNIAPVFAETIIRLGGLAGLFLASLWLGVKIADRAYTLETEGLAASTAGADGRFYRFLRAAAGSGSFASLLVTIFKDYSRRLQNLSRVGYIVGLVVLINLFLVDPDNPVDALVMSQAIFAMLAVFVVGEVTVRGKETLFIYRKAPMGEGRLIRARLAQGWMVTIPIAAAVTAAQLSITPGTGLGKVLIYTGYVSALVAAHVVFALGLFLMMPAFSDKGGEFLTTAMVVVMFASISFILSLIFLGPVRGLALILALSWLVGAIILFLGRKNLGRIE